VMRSRRRNRERLGATPSRSRNRSLKPTVGIEAPWTEIATVARQLVDRAFKGKAVLHLSD
jgi:hypothetical protein